MQKLDENSTVNNTSLFMKVKQRTHASVAEKKAQTKNAFADVMTKTAPICGGTTMATRSPSFNATQQSIPPPQSRMTSSLDALDKTMNSTLGTDPNPDPFSTTDLYSTLSKTGKNRPSDLRRGSDSSNVSNLSMSSSGRGGQLQRGASAILGNTFTQSNSMMNVLGGTGTGLIKKKKRNNKIKFDHQLSLSSMSTPEMLQMELLKSMKNMQQHSDIVKDGIIRAQQSIQFGDDKVQHFVMKVAAEKMSERIYNWYMGADVISRQAIGFSSIICEISRLSTFRAFSQ